MRLLSEIKEENPVHAQKVIIWLALFLLLAISVALFCWGINNHLGRAGNAYAVSVDSSELGLLSQEKLLDEMLKTLQDEAEAFYGMPVVAVEEINVEEVFCPFQEKDPEKILSQLRQMLSYKVKAKMVMVDGRDILPVATEEEVDEITSLLAGAYLPHKSNVSLEEVQIGEAISSRSCCVYPEDLYDVETLASILLRGTDRKETYLVSRGDSLWKIARNYDLTVEELKEANPQINGDAIRIGDEINLIVPEPLVNVKTVERMVIEESIPFNTKYTYDSNIWRVQTRIIEAGTLGRREVVYQITRENGVETAREKIQEKIIEEPGDQVVARGTADIPSRGTGGFVWPVQGGGRISSVYGWRNGSFHAGVDIAAPKGTPVLASDSGVVVSQGWERNYGLSIVICHGHNYTRYAHNSQNLVTTGQAVNKGDVIAYVGSTGMSTGSHLHFEIRTGGEYGPTSDPLGYFRP